jgi:hypothetical protein
MMVFTSSLNVLDQRLVERVAAGLFTSPGLVEKNWHITHALGLLAREGAPNSVIAKFMHSSLTPARRDALLGSD